MASSPNIKETIPLSRPGSHPAHPGALAAVVAVVDHRKVPAQEQDVRTNDQVHQRKIQNSPHSRPNPFVEHSLVIELPVPDRNVKKSLPDVQRLLQVVVVVGAPEAGEDGGDVEGAVPHDVELLESLPHPLVHGSLLARHQVAVHVAGAEHLHSWVSESLSEGDLLSVSITLEAFLHLKSPKSSNWEFLVQISN